MNSNSSNPHGGHEWCNRTLYLSVYNLTSSYTDKRNETTIVTTTTVMFILAAIFFNLNLYSRFTQVSAILNPTIRVFLSASLSLFLPVMSYLFSEAKNEGAATGEMTELPQRARTILMWMLLVELLRKKVEAISRQAYSGTIERAARIGWLGYLIFFNLRSAGKKALYATLWVLAAGKLVQRFVTMELAKRSFAYGRNPQLLASYMAQMLLSRDGDAEQLSGRELLKQCDYIVMGEEDLEKKAAPDSYVFPEATRNGETIAVTVGEIWKLAQTDDLFQEEGPSLRRLCLSFTLYKLLRRRLEDFPITDEEARNCHDLIFKGLLRDDDAGDSDAAAAATTLFQVFNDEVQFLCEYYHSVHPVMLASPFFFLVNYILFPMVVWALCILTIILCSNGDVRYAFDSFNDDNYVTAVGIVKIAICIMLKIRETRSPMALYSTVDICISILLFLAFFYEQVWEFIVFLLSNWFLVSLLCSYTRNRRWGESPLTRRAIRCILWMRRKLSYPNICFKQFSVLWFRRWPSSWLRTVAVPEEAKKSIMECLANNIDRVIPRSNGTLALHSNQLSDHLSWACGDGGSIAEAIITWHIATALLEARHPRKEQLKATEPHSRKVATALSRYCAYLVAFHPELLPDDKDGTERVYKETNEELKKEMGCWRYYLSRKDARCDKLMEIARRTPAPVPEGTTALRRGARLGKALIEQHEGAAGDAGRERVWKLVADVWTEVVVCAAPTGSEVHVKAHKEALAQGMEFITVLWALATHTGISRGPVPVTTPAAAAAPATPTMFRSISIERA
ncbi:hypothetical protein GQ55_1G126300 [Panicum hallii var. hallii]|uniref:DUF4220 domain-containing protein n=1 Tax=Panicum hallii var. hallii TaxID=1504633 RepID=A0A2T7F4X8_9POAL|nr:hypothetical protein GQ55_1G126300 [Panicum hallii var. hallii]